MRLKIGGGTKKKAAAANAVTNNGTSFLVEDSRLAKMPGTKGMEVTMVPNGMLMSAAAYAENGALQSEGEGEWVRIVGEYEHMNNAWRPEPSHPPHPSNNVPLS